jgi:4'-phosphopantetheinyl transferase
MVDPLEHLLSIPDLSNHFSRSPLHVWLFSIPGDFAQYSSLVCCLSDGERDQANRFRQRLDRECFVATHAFVRLTAARFFGISPSEIQFEENSSGKPAFRGRDRVDLRFNISHSGGHCLVGFANRFDIGVDIECVRAGTEELEIARRFFSEEEAVAIERAANTSEMFFQFWALKEAFIKAVGSGLSMPLNTWSVLRASEIGTQELQYPDPDGPRWTIRKLNVPVERCSAAMCWSGPTHYQPELHNWALLD